MTDDAVASGHDDGRVASSSGGDDRLAKLQRQLDELDGATLDDRVSVFESVNAAIVAELATLDEL
ncbi:MAG: hypothetical protein WD011_08640 [Nitriliruptoraceae bacterium]